MKDYEKMPYWKLVQEFVVELKTAKYWLKNDGKPLPEWKLFETRAAAWSAARAAAWDASVFARMLVCLDLKMDVKHLIHLNARMQVWRKGYGLLCDVNGILYVYKKVK